MRLFIGAFLLSVMFCFSVQGKDYSREELVRSLRHQQSVREDSRLNLFLDYLEHGGGPTFLDQCIDGVRDLQIQNCANLEAEVLSDYFTSVVYLNRLRDQIAEYATKAEVRNNPAHRDRLQRISTVVQCMRRTYEGFKLVCLSSHGKNELCNGTFAYTHILIPGTAFLCPSYFLRDRERRAGTLLHELSHKCGTDDSLYLWGPTLNTYRDSPLGVYDPTDFSAKNADNFGFWGVRGFCLPDYDCE